MDSYRPQSPDLSSYAPQSPDLSGLRPRTPEAGGALPSPRFGHSYSRSQDRFGGTFGNPYGGFQGSPTSVPLQPQYQPQQPQFDMASTRHFKSADDDEFLPDAPAPARRGRPPKQSLAPLQSNGPGFTGQHSQLTAPLQSMATQSSDPTLGVQLRTSFPVARIKRIMQADEDVGKVAQVTPHVVSRALELFMIKLISASADEARGPASVGGGTAKGPKKILAQHMKKAVVADDTFDFLADIMGKVPDAAPKGKKEAASDSEDGPSGGGGGPKPAKKRGRKRKESGDDV